MIGKALGHYQVVAKLGEGGMGEVYRARDAGLNRDVAIKVLPDVFAADAERLARFTREAQSLAALNHPGIAQVFGLEGPERRFLVMELVEGEDLSAILARGSIPLAEAIPIARQIAEALEAAHDAGIVHRDLKPGNVRMRIDGVVKVLDFGLAKAHDTHAGRTSSTGAMQSPTMTVHATAMGMILGTAAYMSPEQARGKPVDRRADIWAFGVVLFEMITGARAFKGDETSDILAAVLRQDIDWHELPPDTPLRLRLLLERCLDRDPKTRLRDIGEARVELARLENGAPDPANVGPPAAAPRWRVREAIAWAIAGAGIVAATLLYLRPSAIPSATPAVRLAFVPPAGITFEARGTDAVVVSPDGRMLVFTGRSPDGKRQLYVRALEGIDAKLLPGTDEPITPFWSPDSKSVAFGAQGKLKRVDTAGGGPVVVADAPRLNGGTWNRDGVILFVPDYNAGILRVSDQGGTATVAIALDASRRELSIQDPFFLPDGQHFLYTANSAERDAAAGQVRLGTLSAPDTRLVVQGQRGWFVSPDRLLFSRGGTLFAVPFDPARRELTGDPVPLGAAAQEPQAGESANMFSASDTGVLVLQNSYAPEYQLVWFDRQGQSIAAVHSPTRLRGDPFAPRLSPDGTRVVIQERSTATDRRGIWTIDLGRNLPTRVYAGAGQYPQWSKDGRQIAWTMPFEGVAGIYAKASNGVGAPELFVKAGTTAGGNAFANDWSRDGRFILYHTRGAKTRVDVWALPLFGDRTPHPVLNSEFDDGPAQLSPDGRWLAYRSDASGSYEIYVQSFTAEGRAGGDPVRISTNGGHQPRFRSDGQELFYLANDNRLMAVTIGSRGTLGPGEPKALFKTRTMPRGEQVTFEYDVTRDGQRFLMGTILEGPYALPPPPTIVLNWMAGLTK